MTKRQAWSDKIYWVWRRGHFCHIGYILNR